MASLGVLDALAFQAVVARHAPELHVRACHQLPGIQIVGGVVQLKGEQGDRRKDYRFREARHR